MIQNVDLKLIDTKRTTLSKWVTLVEKKVLNCLGKEEYYHSIDQDDYVTVLALTKDKKVPLVKQFRPALNSISLELPGGLLDRKQEKPEEAARRELYEETGFESTSKIISLGCVNPDSGRLENKLWCFFLPNAEFDNNWKKEKGIDSIQVESNLLKQLILKNEFKQALHVAIVGMASLKGLI